MTSGRVISEEHGPAELLRSDPVFQIAQVLVLVKVMLTVLLMDPRSFDTFTMPKSAAAHGISLVLAALLIWLFARHGRTLLLWSPVHGAVGILLLVFAAAVPFALDREVALFGAFKRYLGLTQMLDNAVLFLSVATLFRDRRSLRLLAGISIGVAVPVLAYALVQFLGLDPFTFQQGPTRIPISTLGNPDIAGAFVSIIGVTALAWALILPGRILSWWRLILGAIGVACLAVLFATGIRAGLLAVVGGWTAAYLLARGMPRAPRGSSFALLGAVVIMAAGLVISPTAARLDPAVLRNDLALLSRLDVWTASARVVIDHPILGVGPDNLVAAYPGLRTEASIKTGVLQNSAHDVWLYMATSAGVLGVAAFGLLVLLLLVAARGLIRKAHPAALALVPLLAYLGQALVNVNEIATDQFFWLAAGVLAGGVSVPVAPSGRRRLARASARTAGLILCTGALVGAALLFASRVGAGEQQLAAEAFTSAARAPEALPYAETLILKDPGRAENWSTLGAALYGAGDAAAAVAAFDAAALRQPWHPDSWKNLALAWSALGDQPAAYAAARKAPSVDPYDGEAHELLAHIAYGQKDYPFAVREGELALKYELAPRDSAYFILISAYVQLKDLATAEPLGREAVARFGTRQLRLQYAAILTDEGKTAEALAIVDVLLKEAPDDQDAQALREAILKKQSG